MDKKDRKLSSLQNPPIEDKFMSSPDQGDLLNIFWVPDDFTFKDLNVRMILQAAKSPFQAEF